MEFEAKLLHAIFKLDAGSGNNTWLVELFRREGEDWDSFVGWLMDYIDYGLTDNFWIGYENFLNIFDQKSDHGGLILNGFPKMSFIEQLRSNCL